jgi:hypothetical protein
MERQTIVLATYGASRDNDHADLMAALKYELELLVFETRESSQIDMARSQLSTMALAHGADVVVFIDKDILFDPLDVERLAMQARETRGIVGAPYSQRRMGAGVVGAIDPGPNGDVTFFEGGGLYPTLGVIGMGFTAIHRHVFELLDPLPEYALRSAQEGVLRPYFQKLVVDGYWLKEDASFCHAARQAGASLMMDTRIRVKHLGQHAFGIEDCRQRSPESPSLKLQLRHIVRP